MLVLLATAACTWTTKRPAPTTTPDPEPKSAAAESPAGEALENVPDDEGPPMAPLPPEASIDHTPLIRIHDVVGTTPEQAGVVLEPATDLIEECGGRGGGALHVRVTTDEDGTQLSVVPGSTVSRATRECVLEAISVSDPGETMGANRAAYSMSPSEQPLRIESQISIQWPNAGE
jgi:hypothetical protein